MEDDISLMRCDDRDLGPAIIHTLVFAQAHLRNNCVINITSAGQVMVLHYRAFQCLFVTTWAPVTCNQGLGMQYQKRNGMYSPTGNALWGLDNSATGGVKKHVRGSRDELLNNAVDCCTVTDNKIAVNDPTTTIFDHFKPSDVLRRLECTHKLAYLIEFLQTDAGSHQNLMFLNGAVEFKVFRHKC